MLMASPSHPDIEPVSRARTSWVRRERVVETLRAALENQLVVLRAGRGAGKSVAVHHLVDSLRHGVRPVHVLDEATRNGDDVAGAVRMMLAARPASDGAPAARCGDVVIIDGIDLDEEDEGALVDLLIDEPDITIVVTARRRTGFERPSVAVRVRSSRLRRRRARVRCRGDGGAAATLRRRAR